MTDKNELPVNAVGATLPPPIVAIVWAQYGPYHFARLKGAQEFSKHWHFVGVEIASQTTTYAWNRENRSVALHTLCPGEASELVGAFKAYLRAYKLFRKLKAAVVFVPSYAPASSFGVMLAAKHAGAGIVMMNESHRHTSKATGIQLFIKRFLVKLFDAALVGGRPQKEYFTEMGLPANRIFDGYDVVDNSFFLEAAANCRKNADALRAKYALPNSYFLNIGRMEEKKNLSLLLEAYAQSCAKDSTMPRLVFVGSGAEEKQLKAQCTTLGLKFADFQDVPQKPGNPSGVDVFFYGFRQMDELPIFYSFARVFILPSKREEWGLVVNEAMACGLPILVSDVAGCAPDLVHNGENGFRFDPADVNEFAHRLRWFGENAPSAGKMGDRSKELIAAWDLKRFAENAGKAANAAMSP